MPCSCSKPSLRSASRGKLVPGRTKSWINRSHELGSAAEFMCTARKPGVGKRSIGLLKPANPATLPHHAPHPPVPPPDQGPGQAHLAACPAARRVRAVRRGAAGCGGRGGTSRLCADRHHQRHRAVPPPYSIHPDPGLSARGSASGPERRQERVRILDPRAVLCADNGPQVLHRRHEAPPPGAAQPVQLGQAGRSAQGAETDQEGRRADDPRHR